MKLTDKLRDTFKSQYPFLFFISGFDSVRSFDRLLSTDPTFIFMPTVENGGREDVTVLRSTRATKYVVQYTVR